jgi:hypothetical protein
MPNGKGRGKIFTRSPAGMKIVTTRAPWFGTLLDESG